MADRSFLAWPFVRPRHRAPAAGLERWAASSMAGLVRPDAHEEGSP